MGVPEDTALPINPGEGCGLLCGGAHTHNASVLFEPCTELVDSGLGVGDGGCKPMQSWLAPQTLQNSLHGYHGWLLRMQSLRICKRVGVITRGLTEIGRVIATFGHEQDPLLR